MPSSSTTKSLFHIAEVHCEDVATYKAIPGTLLLVSTGFRLSVVEKMLAVAAAVEGVTAFIVETLNDLPREALSIFRIIMAGLVAEASTTSAPPEPATRLIFVPDADDRPYLVFDRSVRLSSGRLLFQFIVHHGRMPDECERADLAQALNRGPA